MSPAVPALFTASAGFAALTAATAYGVMYPESQLFGPTLVAPPQPTQLALTFDDGPNPAATPQLLEVLARHHVRATFFLIGRYALQQPTLTRRIAAAGHVIGNHTMTHPFLPRQPASRILAELTDCNRALEDTLGSPITLFRPPHGGRSPAVFRAARSLHLTTVQWNLIVSDWDPVSAQTILARVERGIARHRRRRHGTCVVLHDGGQAALGQQRLPTVQAVKSLLASLLASLPASTPAATSFVTPPYWD